MFVINEPVGTFVDVQAESESDAAVSLTDVYGNQLIFADQGITGAERGSATTQVASPYFVVVEQFSKNFGYFTVQSEWDLIPYNDPDDGETVSVGDTVAASMDYPGDYDYFAIELAEGETIQVTAEAVLIDPYLIIIIDFTGATQSQLVEDDDSGGGLLGLDPKIIYRAPHAGSYLIVVRDAYLTGVGGYLLSVAEAPLARSLWRYRPHLLVR